MRRHPAHVRAAVLNGVAPPSLLNPLFHARNSQSAIDIVFDECAADRACRAAFPNVREEFQAVLARLDREPAPVPILAQPRAGAAAGRLNRYAFADAIRMMMYRVEGTRRVPLAVHRAYGHDYSIVVRSAVEQRRSNARLAHGMLLSTTCQEDIARIRDGDISQASERTFLGPARVRQQQLVCGIWPTGPAPAEDGAAVASDAPVLLLSGTLDPVTPPRWADEALQSLPNGKHLVVPGAHGVGGPCIEQIVRDFVRTGSAQALDTACTSGIKLPPFVIR
jgi:pimeloyl-ACP methyl ester carboxylesterase